MELFRGVDRLLHYLNYAWKRHKVILGNIANADTPNYVKRDVVFTIAEPPVKLKKTREKHITSFSPFESRVVEIKSRLTGNDRNNVSIEEEMAKLVQNRFAYEAYLRFATGSLATLNKVIKGRTE
ncbi:MAG: flagellar basal body rod protein FlgB [Aquificae bacterium]|nr:flagellar basal body rod protein FlgB [Aquificota bacterium]